MLNIFKKLNFQKNNLFVGLLIPLLLLLFSGCGGNNTPAFLTSSYQWNNPANSNSLYKVNNVQGDDFVLDSSVLDPKQPKNKKEFLDGLKKRGIHLDAKTIQQIMNFTKIKSSGKWTPGPMNNPKKNMAGHFKKHGNEFKPAPKTVEEYFENAKNLLNRYDSNTYYFFDTRYYERKIISVVKWDNKTKEFTAFRSNGDIATYFVKFSMAYPRFVYVPRDMHLQHREPPTLTLNPSNNGSEE